MLCKVDHVAQPKTKFSEYTVFANFCLSNLSGQRSHLANDSARFINTSVCTLMHSTAKCPHISSCLVSRLSHILSFLHFLNKMKLYISFFAILLVTIGEAQSEDNEPTPNTDLPSTGNTLELCCLFYEYSPRQSARQSARL